jgi:hypothetical protein
MKRSVYLFILFLLVIAIWSFGPTAREAKALIVVKLTSPGDSTKVTTITPTFGWRDSSTTAAKEKPNRHRIILAQDPDFTSIIWEDSSVLGKTGNPTVYSKVYNGPPLTQWQTYYWTVKVEIDSVRTPRPDTIYWQKDVAPPSIFFYTKATHFYIRADGHGDLPTIQTGIVWAAAKDTVLVEPGVYYENLRFYKKDGILVTSDSLFKQGLLDTTVINKTIIDGSKPLVKEKGSVVFFSSAVDSNTTLRGFTIRGGTGTKKEIGSVQKTCGGGVFCDESSTPTIRYNVITGNRAEDDGGGIFIYWAAPNIFDNIITHDSTANGSGGGIECAYSILVGAPKSSSSDDGEDGENEEVISPEKPGTDAEIKKSSSSSELRLKTGEDEIKNSLNPRDATNVASAKVHHSITKSAANNPPVAVFNYYARKDTIIQREKYLPGDTLFFDGTDSHDPDAGDSIFYRWYQNRYYLCGDNLPTSYDSISSDPIYALPVTETNGGVLKVYLLVSDISNAKDVSDTVTFNIQYPPKADAKNRVVKVADTAWVDGSKSCDVNPADVLSYLWTQISGPLSVTVKDSTLAKTYFVPKDATYRGIYGFQLGVSDSIETTFDTLLLAVSRPPVAACRKHPVYKDTLVGFTTDAPKILDATLSYDPDSVAGDFVKDFVWQSVTRTYLDKDGYHSLNINITTDPTKAYQTFNYAFGGLLKFRLRVRDSVGETSLNYDSVFLSVQLPPFADAGKDTILIPGNTAYITGTGLDINPDDRDGLRYDWKVRKSPAAINVLPSLNVRSIWFSVPDIPSASGVYKLELTVADPYVFSEPDTVFVIANRLPLARVNPWKLNSASVDSHAVEGDTAYLDASLSYDPDSAFSTQAGVLTFSWSAVSWPGAKPEIVDGNQRIAKFVPYATGTYKFRVLVNDTISAKQPPDTAYPEVGDTIGNVTFLTVIVDSTFAYPIIQGNLISHNFAGGKGGGVDCNRSSPDIINNIFYKNQSKSSGGAICVRSSSTPQIKNNIFFGNISSDSTGGAIADLKGKLSPPATRGFRKLTTIQTNDFWDNRGKTFYDTSGTISGNIYSFPRLIDPDFGGFRLECSSPCISKHIGELIYFQPCGTADVLKEIWLSLFQNPVATAVAHFLVNTDAPLKMPPVAYVTMGDWAPSPVYFVPIFSRSYRGSYVFSASGTAKISILASSILEKDTLAADTFSVQLIGAGKAGKLISYDRKVGVLFPEGAAKEDLYATCISVSTDPEHGFEEKSESESMEPDVVTFGEAYQLGPSISFEKELIISFPLSDSDLKDKEKTFFSVYKYEEGKWNQQESYLDGNSVCTKVKSLGVYRLVYDPKGKHITGLPKSFELFQNYPNPFNPETQIRYDLPVSGNVRLTIYNVLGQKVKVLADETQDAGYKSVIWDGKDAGGRDVASGIYFYKIEAQSFEKTKKMVLLK